MICCSIQALLEDEERAWRCIREIRYGGMSAVARYATQASRDMLVERVSIVANGYTNNDKAPPPICSRVYTRQDKDDEYVYARRHTVVMRPYGSDGAINRICQYHYCLLQFSYYYTHTTITFQGIIIKVTINIYYYAFNIIIMAYS